MFFRGVCLSPPINPRQFGASQWQIWATFLINDKNYTYEFFVSFSFPVQKDLLSVWLLYSSSNFKNSQFSVTHKHEALTVECTLSTYPQHCSLQSNVSSAPAGMGRWVKNPILNKQWTVHCKKQKNKTHSVLILTLYTRTSVLYTTPKELTRSIC